MTCQLDKTGGNDEFRYGQSCFSIHDLWVRHAGLPDCTRYAVKIASPCAGIYGNGPCVFDWSDGHLDMLPQFDAASIAHAQTAAALNG